MSSIPQPKPTTISTAMRDLLAQPVPGDVRGRTLAEFVVACLIRLAINGDLEAIKLVFRVMEG